MKTRKSISTRKYLLLLAIFSFGILAVGFVSLRFGESNISVSDFLSSFFTDDLNSRRIKRIILNIRLPRILFAALVGSMLAFAGALMQSVLNNQLASPYTLGISSSAGFGAALAIVCNASLLGGNFAIMGNAFIFACLSVGFIYAILIKSGISKQNIILAGMAVNFLFSSANTILQYFASPDAAYQVMFWMTGTLAHASYKNILILLSILMLSFLCIFPFRNDIGTIMNDEFYAVNIGVNVKVVRLTTLALASLLSASTVTLVGVIGFIGLVAPQLCRLFSVEEPKKLIPLASLIGAFLLVLADFISRILISPSILPIGAITSLIGVPFLVGMIFFNRKNA